MDGADDEPEELPERDFTRYHGYWHGFSFVIFDEQNPEAWVASTWWEPVAGHGDEHPDEDGSEGQR